MYAVIAERKIQVFLEVGPRLEYLLEVLAFSVGAFAVVYGIFALAREILRK